MPPLLTRLLPEPASDRSGVAAAELAMIAPILMFITVGTVDYSMLTLARMKVGGAARAGSAYAVTHGFDQAAISSRIAAGPARSGNRSAIVARPAPAQWYGCPEAVRGVTPAQSAASVCPAGQKAGVYVTTTAEATYTFTLPWPMLPATQVIHASSTVRIN